MTQIKNWVRLWGVDVFIRLAKQSDIGDIIKINASAKEALRSFYHRKDTVPSLSRKPVTATLVIAEVEGKGVARCEFYIQDRRLFFQSLGVLKEFRQRGVFRRLLEFLEASALEQGCSHIQCETIEETGNVFIFRKLGFAVLENRVSESYESPGGGPVHEVLLGKALP